MKYIPLLPMFLFNAFCMGQNKWQIQKPDSSPDTVPQQYFVTFLQDTGTREYISSYFDSKELVTQLSIQDESSNVFYYTTEDGTMIINDSLRTIKWLIRQIVESMKKDYPIKFDSGTVYGNEEPVYHRKRDTVKVLLLICDTFFNEVSATIGVRDTILHLYNTQTFWQYGYSVRELHNTMEEISAEDAAACSECDSDYWEHIFYLDAEKRPLGKSIIVWQELEQ